MILVVQSHFSYRIVPSAASLAYTWLAQRGRLDPYALSLSRPIRRSAFRRIRTVKFLLTLGIPGNDRNAAHFHCTDASERPAFGQGESASSHLSVIRVNC